MYGDALKPSLFTYSMGAMLSNIRVAHSQFGASCRQRGGSDRNTIQEYVSLSQFGIEDKVVGVQNSQQQLLLLLFNPPKQGSDGLNRHYKIKHCLLVFLLYCSNRFKTVQRHTFGVTEHIPALADKNIEILIVFLLPQKTQIIINKSKGNEKSNDIGTARSLDSGCVREREH